MKFIFNIDTCGYGRSIRCDACEKNNTSFFSQAIVELCERVIHVEKEV